MNYQDSSSILLKTSNFNTPFQNIPQLLFDYQQILNFQFLLSEN